EDIFKMEKKKLQGRKIMKLNELITLFYNYQQNKVKNTTLYTYVQRKKYFTILDNIKLHELTVEDYKIWRNSLEETKLSARYKNDVLKFFKELLIFAEKWYGYDFRDLYNKFDKFRDPNVIIEEEINYYTYEEFQKFISVENDLKYKVAFEILYFCGLRRGELLALTWKHINFETKQLSVKQNLVENRIDGGYLVTSSKTRSSIRTIPLTTTLLKHLKELKEKNRKQQNFNENWFVLGNEKYLPITNLMNRKNNNCKLAGLKQIRLHDFRHSCASLLISKNSNVAVVAKYLGHSKIEETLNTYTHFFQSDLDKLIEILDKLNYKCVL
ncbi:MAG: site-specific integrase, partial [Bacilli bacterium]